MILQVPGEPGVTHKLAYIDILGPPRSISSRPDNCHSYNYPVHAFAERERRTNNAVFKRSQALAST